MHMPCRKLLIPNILIWTLCGFRTIAAALLVNEKDKPASPSKHSE